jgi:hypothetical protein
MTTPPGDRVFPVHGSSRPVAAFADHLRAVRDGLDLPVGLITAERPQLPRRGLVRVAHLVTTSDERGQVGDTVVWEAMSADAYRRWLAGAPDPDQAVIEAAVPGLFALRCLHRAGRIDHLHLPELAELLAGRYLSARLTHQHWPLVREAATRAHIDLAAHGFATTRLTPACLVKEPNR